MASVYKTPGVYVEEISKFPPSIAQVETAIPAFIGYTGKADKLFTGDLINIPTKIGSLLEFEFYFGVGPKLTIDEINIDDANNFLSADMTSIYYLYDSVRMFYQNGGGDCYIVSVGIYKNDGTVNKDDFILPGKGIHTLEKYDEPTLLVFPDAVSLSGNGLYEVQTAALSQCNDLQDRFGVFDLKADDPKGVEFKNKIGTSFLKYGAAYSPWLRVVLSKNIRFGDIDGKIKLGGIATTLESLTGNVSLANQVAEVRKAVADEVLVSTDINALAGASTSLRAKFNNLVGAYDETIPAFQAILTFLYNIAKKADDWVGGTIQGAGLLSTFNTHLVSGLKPSIANLIGLENELDSQFTPDYAPLAYTSFGPAGVSELTSSGWGTIFTTPVATDEIPPAAATLKEGMTSLIDNLVVEFEKINKLMLSNFSGGAKEAARTLEDSLLLAFPVYKSILAGLNESINMVPPGGAVVGVYSRVDRNRGVWKAPANESVFNVIEPSVIFSRSELDALNVDVISGKSINAIRSFTGKGTLIFGARTLAGNDNEWRYVSVRRFFNMVEESTKKATEQFVFEPNDANTWVKVQAMIENFLTTLWRAGALQGAKPEHAFYVAVGLGKTMTALDILEGRMIVEIGMAAVRPAEFIILRFSHKMAES